MRDPRIKSGQNSMKMCTDTKQLPGNAKYVPNRSWKSGGNVKAGRAKTFSKGSK